jgi:hypothetical protein
MWAKLGSAMERSAYEKAGLGDTLDCSAALSLARFAEACFWQATGDCASFGLTASGVEQS